MIFMKDRDFKWVKGETMNGEIQKRKKRLWAFCLSLVLAWMQTAPQIVYAAQEYNVVGSLDSDVLDIEGVAYLLPDDVVIYNHGSAYGGDSVIRYYDKDGTTLITSDSNTASGIETGARFTVQDYSGTQIEDGAFKAWEKVSVTGRSGYLTLIELKAVAYAKYNITYMVNGEAYTSSGNPSSYYEGKGVEKLLAEEKEGYTFDGWYSDSSYDAASKVTSISTTQTGAVTLYAKFTANSAGRIDGTGTIQMADIYYGETVKPAYASPTNGTDHVTITYKKKGADDSTYTAQVPVKPGDYTVRAVFAQTDKYLEVTATDAFLITYLSAPASPYSVKGTKGKNNYYTSKVTITPPSGYLIADSLDGAYQDSLELAKSSEAFYVYLKKTDTGAKTAGIKVPAIKIDKVPPAISGAENGETIYGEKAKIVVKDDNLSKVSVNGKTVKFANGKITLLLYSNRGEEQYEIIGTDLAGNKKKIKITVAAEWTKKKTIPSGEKVRLYKNRSYTFGSNAFKVNGDNTTYAAGATFYAGSEGDYVFSEAN